MSTELQFRAHDVLDWYTDAESMLMDFLRYVPYCASHEEIWSPKLVTILQETCSQLDSLWRWEAAHIHSRRGSVDITDYFELYGEALAQRRVVFWAAEPKEIFPFAEWQDATEFRKDRYISLDWWKEAYQKIKHNRLENHNCATLKRTVDALAALFRAIIRCENCWTGMWERHWVSWDDSSSMPFDPLDCLKADFGSSADKGKCGVAHMVIESPLFAYPVGIYGGLVTPQKKFPHWKGNSSRRFKAWYFRLCQSK